MPCFGLARSSGQPPLITGKQPPPATKPSFIRRILGKTTTKMNVEHVGAQIDEHIDNIDPADYDTLLDIHAAIVEQVGEEKAKVDIGIICGSGLGNLADLLTDTFVLPYEKIPGFPKPSVPGHKGNLVFGNMHGLRIVCQQGRFHPYEHDMNLTLCSTPVRIMHLLGVHTLIVSNAAGGVSKRFTFGDIMIIKDHIFLPGLAGFSPLVGLHDKRFGQRFVSVHDCYDHNLRKIALEVSKKENDGVEFADGVYVMSGGPQYESPAEVTLFKTCGADALGMSTAHEVTVARQCGIRVFGFSLITNIANLEVDTAVVVSHEEVLEAAAHGGQKACGFVSRMLQKISELPAHKPNPPVFERRRPRHRSTCIA